MFQQRRVGLKLLGSLLLCLVFSGINLSCSAETPASPSTSNVKSPVPIESPKGPDVVNLTATAQTTMQTTGCPPLVRRVPVTMVGWQIYNDPNFAFQFFFPPAWRAGATMNTGANGSGSSYVVQIFPPASHAPFDWHSSLFDAEHFEITVFLSNPVGSLADDHSYTLEGGNIAIGSTKSVLYARTSADCQEMERFAQIGYAHSQYQFRMKSIPRKAQQDLTLFLGILRSFRKF